MKVHDATTGSFTKKIYDAIIVKYTMDVYRYIHNESIQCNKGSFTMKVYNAIYNYRFIHNESIWCTKDLFTMKVYDAITDLITV